VYNCLIRVSCDRIDRHTNYNCNKPGWSAELVKLHGTAWETILNWTLHSPKNGHAFDMMKESQARFKYNMRAS